MATSLYVQNVWSVAVLHVAVLHGAVLHGAVLHGAVPGAEPLF